MYYGHGEVDIAMSRLFGGFGPQFYEGYYANTDGTKDTRVYTDLYQLYYLLVHLNMFGASYYHAVKKLLTYYFAH